MHHNNDIISGKISSDIENMEWNMGSAQLPNVRFGSSSSQASQNSGDICRICHCESDPQNPLLTPCYCSGSLKYVHQTCLQQWLTASETNSCELCKFPFIMHTKIKPFNEWRSLDMSGVERRRLFCAVLFHFAAALCVIWSLCVLIERAAEEVKRGLIGWPFWTKLVVVTVGLTGGVVFMYIQCRQYLHLCHRWRARNRILLIQNAPEKIHPISPPSPVLIVRHHNLPQNNQMPALMSASNGGSGYNRSTAQSQCVANIENNPMNYERDWHLDDSSQSSFKPCPQGSSGSMTPFHDSAHTMYEANNGSQLRSIHSSMDGCGSDLDLNQIPNSAQVTIPLTGGTSANTIASTSNPDHNINEYSLFKVHSSGHQQQQQNRNTNNQHHHYPTSSVFLENSDILDDKDYPKLYHHRHSAIMMAPDTMNYDSDAKIRRYSDTKLLHASALDDDDDDNDVYMTYNNNQPMPIFNVATVLGASIPSTHDTHAENYQITDIIFDSNTTGTGTYDPLELNIQEMLELDMATSRSALRKPRHSMNNVADGVDEKCNVHYSDQAGSTGANRNNGTNNSPNVNAYVSHPDNRNIFKSMPNLSASSENLLQK
ncbi:uncharacterized protein LOC116336700 [Contarinia nasturtii]|uniref:uncharacterized protein LOC116336700 n=1 Tax=Contarinia nasturtii TaxID=265458 RepID=UPI0012D47436|nr:uncharacterized protein LOC116336700 [Contarinia nasturtii]XP_031616596.1 uncharacterized protein LOC116336700 [Contarinia nasturtii]XP_031616598.1 uncharacterized protein LOC116336700 [Contarinia nasturtii]XP_031616599.1 uncharacterized protein LOC116336700 [Contarinia nasturtii]XP_031616600.1 uncharacterized protein LOC116336700 [Contarinia nasturtii]XP_031616601.1 uncharacterized protein LOC116336700 [Contarinia nasturtii]